jgi:hypothetical protein
MAAPAKRTRGGGRAAAAGLGGDASTSGGSDSSELEERAPVDVPDGHHVVDRVLAFDPKTNEYLIHWRGYSASDRTWQSGRDIGPGAAAVDRFRRRGLANVGWVFPSEGAKRAFHEKHDLIDLGQLPVPIAGDHARNTDLHPVTRDQRKVYVHWLKKRIGQCEWVSGCTHRLRRYVMRPLASTRTSTSVSSRRETTSHAC